MNFVFFGTDDYSVAILEKLISDFYYPSLVISQPDKPVGRKQILTPPPIKHVCETHRLPMLQPAKAIEALDAIKKLGPDLFIVASFGQIIPQQLLDIPRLGAINVHTSLLPRHRGASPIQAAILHGDAVSGVTIMLMDSQLDHGPIIHQERLELSDHETNTSLRSRLATLGADTLCKVLPDFVKGNMKPIEQDHQAATFTKIIKKEDAKIDWNAPCLEIERMVRAYQDWPNAWTLLPNGKRMKILSAQAHPYEERDTRETAGTLRIKNPHASIVCADGILALSAVQVEGKTEISAAEFSRGYQSLSGSLCQ